MGERTKHTPGTFSWTDLSTPDQNAAKAFYTGLFGWDYDDMPAGEGITYSMAKLRGHSVAAISPLPPGMERPAWNCYVTVEDADATAAKAKELGATAFDEPFDVFDAGRMAVIADPQGAVFCIWQPKQNIGAGLVNEPGALTWNQATVPDVEAAQQFYGELFGWTFEQVEGSDVPYWNFRTSEGGLNGGMMAPPPGAEIPPHWQSTFTVEDLHAAAAQVRDSGGQVLVEPTKFVIGSFAVLQDPQGAVFGLYEGDVDP